MSASLNPLDYHPAQIAKALVALLTSVLGFLGLAASVFADGGLVTAGHWATAAALFLAPILVFMQKAQSVIDVVDGEDAGGADRTAAGD